MPKVDVYDIKGKKVSDVELNEKVENHGDKKEQVEQDKVLLEHHNGLKVV